MPLYWRVSAPSSISQSYFLWQTKFLLLRSCPNQPLSLCDPPKWFKWHIRALGRVCLTSFSWILLTYSNTYFVRVFLLPDYVPMSCSFGLSVSISSQPLSVFLKLPRLPSKFSVINSPWKDKAEPHGALRPSAKSQTLRGGSHTVSWTVAGALSHGTLARINENRTPRGNPGLTRLLCTPSFERS